MKSLQMQSCVHEEGTIECALFEVDIASPKDNEVMVKIEASPINPSDLGLMFGAADVGSIRASERNGHPSIVLDVPAPAMRAMATRVGEWLPVGNEACGTVVEAGAALRRRRCSGSASRYSVGKCTRTTERYRFSNAFPCPIAQRRRREPRAS